MASRQRFAAVLFACAVVFAILTAFSLFLPTSHHTPLRGIHEDWRSDLSGVRSVDQAVAILPRYFAREQGTRDERIVKGIDQFVRDRFLHGIAKTSFKEDWLDWFAGLVWLNLREPVLPDEILEHRHALCSQQSIVYEALLKHFGVEYASVLMRWPSPDPLSQGHFAVAAKIDGKWRYFDADQEARAMGVPIADVIDGRALARLYPDKPALRANMAYAAAHRNIFMAHVNEFPASHGAFFQETTRWLSAFGWMMFAALGLFCLVVPLPRRRKNPLADLAVPVSEPSFAATAAAGFPGNSISKAA